MSDAEKISPLAAPSPAVPSRRRLWLWLWLALLAVGWHAMFMASPRWLGFFGFGAEYPLFIDSYAVLAAGETYALGGDPFQPMVLDPFNHRPHSYSSWWFALGDAGLTRADNAWFGALLAVAFAVAALAALRPRATGELWWLLGTACSAPVLLATTRGNNDLVIFALLAPLVPCLLYPSRLVRLAAPFLVVAAAGLKYYPVVAALLLLAEPEPRDRRFRLGLLFLLLLMAGLSVGGDLVHIAATQPNVQGYLGFGAAPGLGLLGVPARWQGWEGMLVGLELGFGAFFTRGWSGWLRRAAGEAQWLRFILGATLLAGCFWTGLSWAYRWVFALWLVPFLWRPVLAEMMPAAARRWWCVARAAYWPALWGGCGWFLIYDWLTTHGHELPYWIRIDMWRAIQAAHWVFCGALTVLVGAFAWEGLRGLWPGRVRAPA
jgi:hypothetical protein